LEQIIYYNLFPQILTVIIYLTNVDAFNYIYAINKYSYNYLFIYLYTYLLILGSVFVKGVDGFFFCALTYIYILSRYSNRNK
jgi:hypothetical protein